MKLYANNKFWSIIIISIITIQSFFSKKSLIFMLLILFTIQLHLLVDLIANCKKLMIQFKLFSSELINNHKFRYKNYNKTMCLLVVNNNK
jgi:hypothetical protein